MNKHLAFELLMKRMTEDEEVLFVSEAKAEVLNEQKKALGMKEIADTTRVPLMSFLVLAAQMGPGYCTVGAPTGKLGAGYIH